jgi:diaminohydroxyphosphoribosylaminopyrimidine deaminase/5-amino-6-(5-phosphoribosylamino)uracil reductase
MPVSTKDRKFMKMAIDEMGKSRDDPEHTDKRDPLVGAVLVTPTGKVYKTHRARLREGDHAEETLLERLLHDKDVEGSTLYVTLEPCSSRGGRTPCAQLICSARVRRVFIGIPDPNPDIEGHGVAYLRKRHVEAHFFDDDLALVSCN